MHNYLTIGAAILALMLSPGSSELTRNLSSTTADIKIGRTIEVRKLDESVFRSVICNFSVMQASSTPPSVVLAGKVVSNNTGAAREFASVFFGSTLHHPRLAALTNVDGEFRFRVWLLDGRKEGPTFPLQAKDLAESTLYLEGKFDADAQMLSSRTHPHPLREFLDGSRKKG